jgi:hypothetical protein
MPVIEANVDTIVLSRNAARAAARSKEMDPSTEILELVENICRRSNAQVKLRRTVGAVLVYSFLMVSLCVFRRRKCTA